MARWIVRFGFAAVLLALSAMARGDDLPRYALKPGMILDYEERATIRDAGGDSKLLWRSRVWVVDHGGDGGARVVVRQALTREGKGEEGGDGDEIWTSFARFDVQPNGAIPFNPSRDSYIDPSVFFPRLPDNADEAAGGWRSRDDRDDASAAYRRIDGDKGGNEFTFEADESSYRERSYEGKNHRVFYFDRERGLIVRAEIVRAFGAHMQSEAKGTLELKAASAMTPAETARFREETGRYFDAAEASKEAWRKAMKAGDGAEAIVNEARTALTNARAEVSLPEPAAALDELLKNSDQSAKSVIEDAKRFAEISGKPAPGWGPTESPKDQAAADSEINDLNGRPQSLARHRGKVLVLDFWYRGCGWCMRAMPQVKMLAERYRDQPVAIFGMNNDRDEKDARFVVETMKLDYPVIRSDDLAQRYGVPRFGFPTLMIIDQQGKIADIHVGYSPQLFEQVSESIDGLLKSAE